MQTASIRASIENPWSKESDRENCCGIFSLEAGVVFIGIVMIVATGFLLLLGVYNQHFLFFAPLVAVMGAYCIVFVVHKVVPEKDDIAGRQMLFFLMVFITLGILGYGIIFANEIFNNVPTEMCKQQITMGNKECVSWLTGIPGNFGVLVITVINVYFAYIHLEYLNDITEDYAGKIEFVDEETNPNNPYGQRRR